MLKTNGGGTAAVDARSVAISALTTAVTLIRLVGAFRIGIAASSTYVATVGATCGAFRTSDVY